MIQGGDPTGTGMGGESVWGRTFKDEIDPNRSFDTPGLLAMANAGPNTNGSQFFITTVALPDLPRNYTIFGKVISGMAVVHKIEQTPTDSNDRPLTQQTILSAEVKKG